ncbi:hypothetical protein M8J77_009460 [Diaphorina citri]|nr:hypothetical protein M8J77_009460 [Diaphorina citri]
MKSGIILRSYMTLWLLVMAGHFQGATTFSTFGNRTTAELIQSFGYPVEKHIIESGDGFLLNMFRIPNQDGPAVLITHGLLLATDFWVLRGPKHDLAFMLADRGYDVWLADTRGNYYSHKHTIFEETDAKFWDFSFDENGFFDLPALIDYILIRKPGQSRIFYIGHSLGTTMFFAMCNTRPEYNDKIHLMIGLAPAAYFDKLLFLPDNASARTARYVRNALKKSSDVLRTYEVLPRNRAAVTTTKTFCGPNAITLPLCHFIISAFFGVSPPGDMSQVEKRYVANFTSVIPAGTSFRTFDHLMQLALARKFQHYDFGPKGNLERYGSRNVPQYDLAKVTVPVALFYSVSDMLIAPKNVDRTASELPNLVSVDKVTVPNFNHLDFIWGKDARVMAYNKIVRLLETGSTIQYRR